MGSTTSQGRIARFADMYSWIHTQYRRLMARIQKYIAGSKKKDKMLRGEDEKKEDPFEKKEREREREDCGREDTEV